MAQHEWACSLGKDVSPFRYSSPLSATSQKNKTGDFQSEEEGVYEEVLSIPKTDGFFQLCKG